MVPILDGNSFSEINFIFVTTVGRSKCQLNRLNYRDPCKRAHQSLSYHLKLPEVYICRIKTRIVRHVDYLVLQNCILMGILVHG